MNTDRTIDEILADCQRFRILSVGRSGAGKSSVINCVFNVDDAKVSHNKPGEADIYQEITSEQNARFVLHDSKGFEPARTETFNIVREFILEKSDSSRDLEDRLHAAWLCIQTPTHGGRVLEAGDEQFLELANKLQIPVVVVFTQYDRLVRKHENTCANCKDCETCEKCENLEPCENRKNPEPCQSCKAEAQSEFDRHVKILEKAAIRLNIDKTKWTNVSVKEGYTDNITLLVNMTREIVEERLKGDAWIIWSVAQMASLPLKIKACIENGMNYYFKALGGVIPLAGGQLLSDCLLQVHKDITACWNLPDAEGVLNGDEFKHLMLFVVKDVQNKCDTQSSPVDLERINQFVTLCATASATIAPPAAILGLSFIFMQLIASAVSDRAHDAHRVLIAYTVDLILVLEELLKMMLRLKSSANVSSDDLREALAAFRDTTSKGTVHSGVKRLVEEHGQLRKDLILDGVKRLLHEHRAM
ncbi:hypothetical protein MVEN_01118800 [Mycena venus]|uniref:G domain-containing protein n=1 Tax=Mycena venus TaxID=2733690 RepID=A0A8H6Y9J5_9AGAR|nr:hypothetical protein MVEN_01118800 [Mycena venus]